VSSPFRQPLAGQRLRELRERAGMSREQLAVATGVSASAIVRLENGKDVRLSTYFPIIEFFVGRDLLPWLLAERLVLLDHARHAELAAWLDELERSPHD
jgi:transcriptional regulator with XRE-family HTH domain